MICVSIGRGRHRHVLAEYRHLVDQGASLVELRLDYINGDVNLRRLLADRPCPAIIACRRPEDGGKYAGTEEQRQLLLRAAIAEGVDYVDLEHDVAALIPRFGRTKRIVSHHDFRKTPENIEELHARMTELDPDIIKICTMANHPHDNVRILELVRTSKIPTIGLCMGDIGVPTRILYDNTKIAVAKILGGEERKKTKAFSELQSYYLFADKFGRPARGNDKGKVEGLVGYARRNFMVPIPRASSWEELNLHLEADCRKRRERRLRGHTETIGERFERDRAALLPLPAAPYEACEKISARVSSLSLVRYRSNDYSVPTEYGHRQVWVKGYVHEVVIACGSEVIARHQRSYEREAVVFDPLHYLALLEQKTRALDQAAPLACWQLPECFAQLRRLLEARLKKHGSREYVQVLRLVETFDIAEVTLAVEQALKLGTISFDAVRHLLLCRIERRPPRLDMENYPHLPLAHVRTTQAADYMALLVEVCA